MWSAESTDLDGFTPLVVAAEHSTRLRLATGIVNVYTRGPAVLAQTAAAVADVSNGRFVLGLGASSNVIVEQWNGIPFRRPLAKVEETVAYLRTVLAGERGAGGFKLASSTGRARADRPRGSARPHAGPGRADRRRGLHQLPAAEPLRAGRRGVRSRRRRSSRADSSRSTAPRPRRLRPRSGSSSRTRRCRSTPSSSAGWASVTRSIPWSQRGTRAIASVRSSSRPRRSSARSFCSARVEAQRERLAEFAAAGIDTAVLALFCPPSEVPGLIDAFAPGLDGHRRATDRRSTIRRARRC